jgi:hypothetical protein
VNAGAPRALDLHGEIDAVDENGHHIRFRFEGRRIEVRLDGARAALAAARCVPALRHHGLMRLACALARQSPVPVQDFEIELRLGGRAVGRAGHEAEPNWLGRLLGAPGVELRFFALLAAVARAR